MVCWNPAKILFQSLEHFVAHSADRPDDAAHHADAVDRNRHWTPFPPLPGYVTEHRALEQFDLSPGGVSHHTWLAIRPTSAVSRVALSMDKRIARILTGAGFPQLLIERGSVVLSGFVVEPESDERARIRWIGSAEVNALPYRRTFLSVYAQPLREAGFDVQYVDDRDEPYLVCTSGCVLRDWPDLPG